MLLNIYQSLHKKAKSVCAEGKHWVMLKRKSGWCSVSHQVPPFGQQRTNKLRPNVSGSSYVDVLGFFFFFKTKLWGSETVPRLSALAQAPHTGSSIRILLLPRPCCDLAVNLQTPSPFIRFRSGPSKVGEAAYPPSRRSAPHYSLAFIVTVMYVH